MNRIQLSFIFFAGLAITGCKNPVKNEPQATAKNNSGITDSISNTFSRFIVPPIPGADILYKESIVDATGGDTLFYKSGSIILFPRNSFVTKEGQIVKGKVQVKYREFRDAIDFYLSGIPMNYDSADKKYIFESSGMCEILAYNEGTPVFVNPASKPEIYMASNNAAPMHNIYFLDSTQKKWVCKDKSPVIDITKINTSTNKNVAIINEREDIIEPLKPEKANDKSPVIKIIIDPSSFKELLVYDNMQFQLLQGSNFNATDTLVEWNYIDLQRGSSKGTYKITFSKVGRSVTYFATPVLEGDDYKKALKVYEKNTIRYGKMLGKRITQQKLNKEKYLKDSINNRLIEEQNEVTRKINKLIEARNKQVQALIDRDKSNTLIRGFSIDQFGIWNCDRGIDPSCFYINATFKNRQNSEITLTNIAVIHKSLNTIREATSNRIPLSSVLENMIIGTYEGKFAYITYDQLKQLKLSPDTKNVTFTINIVSEKDNNYMFIKSLALQP